MTQTEMPETPADRTARAYRLSGYADWIIWLVSIFAMAYFGYWWGIKTSTANATMTKSGSAPALVSSERAPGLREETGPARFYTFTLAEVLALQSFCIQEGITYGWQLRESLGELPTMEQPDFTDIEALLPQDQYLLIEPQEGL